MGYFWPLLLIIVILHHAFGSGLTLHYSVLEEEPINTYIGNAARDSGFESVYSHENLSFAFVENREREFRIDKSTGNIFTAKMLDREQLCAGQSECSVSLTVAVTISTPSNNGTSLSPWMKLMGVRIEVIDINDNAPIFPVESMIFAVHNPITADQVFFLVEAVDPDSGINSNVSFELVPESSVFLLRETKNVQGRDDLRLELKHALDPGTREVYKMVVVVTDSGMPPQSGSASVTVYVNWNNPDIVG